MDAALLLTALAGHARDRVQVLAGDRVVQARVAGADRAKLLHDTISTLAPVEARLIEADWGLLATEIRRLGTQRALVVLLTPLESSAVEQGLLPVLPALSAHHRVVVASVADPAVATDARGPRDRGARSTTRPPPSGPRRCADAPRRPWPASGSTSRRAARPAADPARRPLPHAQAAGPALTPWLGTPGAGGLPRASGPSAGQAATDPRRRVPRVEVAGDARAVGATADHEHVGEEGRLGDHTDADAGPGRQPGRGDEALDGAADAAAPRPARSRWRSPCAPRRRRPAAGSAGPGSTHDQNSRSPTAAATNTAVSSSSPCGRIRPKKRLVRSLAIISAAMMPTLGRC